MRWVAVGVYVLLTGTAFMARNSGHEAEEAVEGALSDAGQEELEEHEHHGHNLFLWGVGISAMLGVSFVAKTPVRVGSAWLAVALGVAAAERIAHTADHGGRLVYVHGAASGLDLSAVFGDAATTPTDDPRITHFREVVRPILVDNCLRCHRPGRAKRAGGLDQTSIATILQGGDSGPAIVPGDPDGSLLIQAVRWENPDLEMPAGEEKLSDQQIASLEKWIADGAAWEPFEFVPPSR
jgi:mono/diheme cytochrome c family protein